MDDIEAVFQVLEDEKQGLGFGDEVGDLITDNPSVSDVLAEEACLGERHGLKRGKHLADEGREIAYLRRLESHVVEDALGPASGGEDDVDGAADVGIEFLQVVGGSAGGFDEAVEFEDEFVAGTEGGEADDLAEVADGSFAAFHVEGEGHGGARGGEDVGEVGVGGHESIEFWIGGG